MEGGSLNPASDSRDIGTRELGRAVLHDMSHDVRKREKETRGEKRGRMGSDPVGCGELGESWILLDGSYMAGCVDRRSHVVYD